MQIIEYNTALKINISIQNYFNDKICMLNKNTLGVKCKVNKSSMYTVKPAVLKFDCYYYSSVQSPTDYTYVYILYSIVSLGLL